MSDIVKVLRDLCDNNYNESISLEGLDAMEAAIEEIKKLRAQLEELTGGHVKSVPGEVSSLPQTPDPNPAPAMCIWRSNLTPKQSGLYHEVFWIRCDGSHVQAVATNTPCFVCGKQIKFA